MLEIGRMIEGMVMVFISSSMVINTKEAGTKVTCKEQVRTTNLP